MASFVEPFDAGQQQLADPIERVAFMAAVAERLVLHPPADLVDAPVGDPHDMERIGHTGGVIEPAPAMPARNDSARSVATVEMSASLAGSWSSSHRRRSVAALPSTM